MSRMTLYSQTPLPLNNNAAPVLDADRQEAAQLWEQVKGTELESRYREVSAQHAKKSESRSAYLIFLEDIKALFVSAEPGEEEIQPEEAEVQPEMEMDESEEAGKDGGEDAGDGGDEEADEAAPATPPASGPTGEAGTGLFSQLYGMLHDGGEVTIQVMRVGEELTLGIFPKAVPGEQQPQSVVTTEKAQWFDAHLLEAMRPYVQARVDAFDTFAKAAAQQAAQSKKAAEKPAQKGGAKTVTPKGFKLTLQAAEGTTLSGKQGDKDVTLSVGENQVDKGTLTITAKHDLFGEVTKTLNISSDRSHDLREQQGGYVTVKATPESAALSASKGDTHLSLHGETLLPPGKWTIHGEAADYETASLTLNVKAGGRQEATLNLEEKRTLF